MEVERLQKTTVESIFAGPRMVAVSAVEV